MAADQDHGEQDCGGDRQPVGADRDCAQRCAGLDRPVLIAAVVALVAVGMGGAALRSRSRTATVTAVLATVVSLLGALLIL